MAPDQMATKEALLQAAGELFADLGFDGASTREIARRAGTNMASIGYHFGGKENLYLETLRFVLTKENTWGDALEAALARTEQGTPVSEALCATIRTRLEETFGGVHPIWQTKLIVRALLEPSPALRALIHENFAPEFARATAVARAWNPALSEAQAKLWTNSLFGQEIVYVLAQTIMLEMEQWAAYPAGYLDEVAAHTARLMTAALWLGELDTGRGNEEVPQ